MAVGLVVIDVKTQDVAVFDGVSDGVFVQRLLKEVLRGLQRLFFAADLLDAGVSFKNRRAGEAEELGLGEERFDGLVVVAKLRAVAFVEEDRKSVV